MLVHEKIRLARQVKGWSQEETACKLEMSANGYGCIERGETDVNLSRLEQIAGLFDVKLADWFDSSEKSNFNQSGTNNQQYTLNVNSFSPDYLQLKAELEKLQVIVERQEREIECLKEINALLKNAK